MQFYYKAINKKGETEEGSIESCSRKSAIDDLKRRGRYAMEVMTQDQKKEKDRPKGIFERIVEFFA